MKDPSSSPPETWLLAHEQPPAMDVAARLHEPACGGGARPGRLALAEGTQGVHVRVRIVPKEAPPGPPGGYAAAQVPAAPVVSTGDGPPGSRLQAIGSRRSPPAMAQVCNLSGVRVLFVDDDEPVRSLVAAMLKRLLATATVVSSPLEALRLVREDDERFDVLVTDLSMPEMGGDQLFRRVRELAPALPVVIVSGDVLDRKIKACLEQGAHGFLAKPFTMGGFAQAIYDAYNPGSLPS